MKFLVCLMAVISALIFTVPVFSQCAGATLPLTVQYDTTVTGIGNSSYNFTFPKFDPSLGTFLSVNFQSAVNLSYSYTVQNQDATPVTVKTRILRDDYIGAPEFGGADISASFQTAQVTNSLTANQLLVYGPAHFSYTLKDSINNGSLINFEGPGNVNYDYEQATSYNLQIIPSGHVSINFNYIQDTTKFTVIYKYCTNVLLSQDKLSFNASLQSKNTALLTWKQATVRQSRMYEVQASLDGTTFDHLSVLEENATGVYDYTYLNNSAKKVFFRIQERNASGEIKYSDTRLVEFNNDTKTPITVFPTLYNGGNLRINFPEQGNWQIIMYAADGRKVLESHQENCVSALFSVPAQWANGFYLIEVLNSHSQQRQMNRIMVQR